MRALQSCLAQVVLGRPRGRFQFASGALPQLIPMQFRLYRERQRHHVPRLHAGLLLNGAGLHFFHAHAIFHLDPEQVPYFSAARGTDWTHVS